MRTIELPNFTLTESAAGRLATVNTLIVPTSTDDTDCLAAAREAAAAISGERDVTVVLYDRSDETWMDTPHPSGPHRADDLGDEHAELRDQLRGLESSGVTALGWISTVPAITEIMTAAQATEADAVLLPSSSCGQSFTDRLTGARDVTDEVAGELERDLTQPVTVFSLDDGTIDVVATTGHGTARG